MQEAIFWIIQDNINLVGCGDDHELHRVDAWKTRYRGDRAYHCNVNLQALLGGL